MPNLKLIIIIALATLILVSLFIWVVNHFSKNLLHKAGYIILIVLGALPVFLLPALYAKPIALLDGLSGTQDIFSVWYNLQAGINGFADAFNMTLSVIVAIAIILSSVLSIGIGIRGLLEHRK